MLEKYKKMQKLKAEIEKTKNPMKKARIFEELATIGFELNGELINKVLVLEELAGVK